MNFAEKLMTWRDSETHIKWCETSIDKLIGLRCGSIMSNLIKDDFTQIAVTEFDYYEFCNSIHQTLCKQYTKNIDFSLLLLRIMEQLYSYTNIFIFNSTDFISSDINTKLIILYKKEIKDNNQEVFNIIEHLFYEYILPNFEQKYKAKNLTEVTFSPNFSLNYNITPIAKMINEMRITATTDDILDIVERLAKISGVTFKKDDIDKAEFSLSI